MALENASAGVSAPDAGWSKPATLKDVAEAARVSVATASKALTGGYRVKAETSRRVKEAAQALHFAPNQLAASLLNGRSGTVGLITNDLEGRFSIPVMGGAEDAFGTDQVSVFLCDARGDAVREQHHVRALLSRRVDGLIFVGDSTNVREPFRGPLPVPAVYAYAPSRNPDDVSVITDDVGAGGLAARHLIDYGRRRIAYVSGDPTFLAAQRRAAGALAELDAAGLEVVGGKAFFLDWSEAWAREATQALLAAHPDIDGILCASDQLARGVLDGVRESGRHVPQDVSVVGHDNWEHLAKQSRPPLSTIDMNLAAVGREAARLLFDAIAGDVSCGEHVIETRLVTRASSFYVA